MKIRNVLALVLGVSISCSAFAVGGRNVVIFVADGLRPGSVNATDAPTMLSIRQNGVFFANSHSLFPTFTDPNATVIATGHYLGDTGDFFNTLYIGYPVFNTGNFGKTAGSPIAFLEDDQILADVNGHYSGNYLNEESLLHVARQHGYVTAAIGKVGPAGMQNVRQIQTLDKKFVIHELGAIVIDDATGSASGVPLDPTIAAALAKAGLSPAPPPRSQPGGNNTTPGTLRANVGQQQWFADATTKAVLPALKASDRPFALVFWSRDPDGTQHSHGDSLNSLTPGINGPTSRAAVKNADNNLKQILDYINSDPELAANTDIFITADHGFATISRHEIDAAGHATASYSAKFTYRDSGGRVEVNPGFLPPGFLAIDLAHALGMPLHDPSGQIGDGKGAKQYVPVNPTIPQQVAATRQRPETGSALIGASGKIMEQTDAKVIIAANGGSDAIYVPDHAPQRVRAIVTFLTKQDYVGAIFVDDRFGKIPGALPLSSIRLKGATLMPTPAVAVGFKTFPLDPANPLMSAIQIADATYQQGQGHHGSFGRDNTFNNMAAIGPDFKKGYVDQAPVSNADIAPTIARLLGFKLPTKGKLQGRVLVEALQEGPESVSFTRKMMRSGKADGKSTVLFYQRLHKQLYFDEACFLGGPQRQTSCQ
jgi:arylsulfatase A-like enzyme